MQRCFSVCFPQNVPADRHCYYNGLPPRAENLPGLRVLSGHHRPQWDQSQEDQTHQGGQVPNVCGTATGVRRNTENTSTRRRSQMMRNNGAQWKQGAHTGPRDVAVRYARHTPDGLSARQNVGFAALLCLGCQLDKLKKGFMFCPNISWHVTHLKLLFSTTGNI